ncbi:efflux RND transporter periplasmic adaptor subunit [Oceanospirillum linum]|uniref:CzcB-like barrel-sandwich hybrid domain-containing protein n=1 Tax=Oceanospirillum linum TaxID=966 RepID=A0A1T1H875_OCELI|nr:efflux RND transporter periplasmic adaptor subunit [Oceanospirillum linum]OOV86079.1 hypothetical protein BTA35_0215180 [Oceanospirillum linum]SEG41572.1 RND family efflux transporter, MFP subunit [Oleiphilus messinensis]SMP33552.1 RND family efflux transporter, MFP subunit [Oceanospirillum linum]
MSSKKTIISIAIAAVVVAGFIALELRPVTSSQASQPAASQPVETSNAVLVSVVTTTSGTTEAPVIEGFGTAQALWNTTLSAQVKGQVESVSEKLLVGSAFNKGDELARINDIDYLSLLATAKADLAAAKVNFLEQQQQTEQAQERWQLSGLEGSPSDLVLQLPQLQQAKDELEAAQAAVNKARQDLKRTRITAPFNGRVASRNISLGTYVNVGSEVAQVFATNNVEVEIALNGQQFSLLGEEKEALQRSVQLIDSADSSRSWSAKIVRFQYQVDDTNRSRKLVLQVNNQQQSTDLLPGTFVKAFIPGKTLSGLLKLPASALSREGYIWHVKDGLLQRFRADTVYSNNDYIMVHSPNAEDTSVPLNIVRYPQSGFLPGQKAQIKAEAEL